MGKYCVTFAGAVGSSKTPIAYCLSQILRWPIFNGDAIRTETTEDEGWFDIPEFERRRDVRLRTMIGTGHPFILDSSVDRTWQQHKKEAAQAGYKVFVISLDLSKTLLYKLYEAKGYDQAQIEKYYGDHAEFLTHFSQDVGLHITDEDFPNRLELSAAAVHGWLQKMEGA